MIKDIDFHFTQMTIKESDAPRVKLWKQLYEGWVEKQKSKVSGSLNEGIKQEIRTDPALKKAVKVYEDEIKKQEYRKKGNGSR